MCALRLRSSLALEVAAVSTSVTLSACDVLFELHENIFDYISATSNCLAKLAGSSISLLEAGDAVPKSGRTDEVSNTGLF